MEKASKWVDPVQLSEAFDALETEHLVAFEVYRQRRLTPGKPPTLQAIGEERGISRERVRQLESRFDLTLKRVTADPSHPVHRASLFLRERLGGLSRAATLAKALAELEGGSSGAIAPEHRIQILLELAGPYEIKGDWCSRCSLSEDTDSLLYHLTKKGPIPLSSAIKGLVPLGISQEDAKAWLGLSKDYTVIEGHLARRGRSIVDRGVLILTVRGEPMTLEEIFEVLDEKRNFRGFKARMQEDPRVMRRGIKHYGLAEWGGKEYTSINDEMAQEIERRGGSADLQELAEFLSERFGASPNSVRMHSQGAQFLVDEKGCVAVASKPQVPETTPLPLTRGCFRLPSGWAFRRTVNHYVTRGSGSGIPLSFARELGLRPGDSVQFETPYGRLRFSWPNHMAHMGSLRAAAKAYGAREGDYLFVVSRGEQRADVLHVAAADWERSSGLEQLGKRCGCDVGTLEEVAAALGMDAGVSDSPIATRIRQQLLQRGEGELAELVRDEDDLLEALVDL